MNSMRKYALPDFLADRLDQKRYERWLHNKARAHANGDVERFGQKHSAERYRNLIHAAVCSSMGKDFYTGEELHWEKISTYDNDRSKSGKTKYKADFALLPTVDHVWNDDNSFDFVICGWRTNDAKSDLPLRELLELCERILRNHGYRIDKPAT